MRILTLLKPHTGAHINSFRSTSKPCGLGGAEQRHPWEENVPASKAATDTAWRGESESVILVSDLSQLTVKQRPKWEREVYHTISGKTR